MQFDTNSYTTQGGIFISRSVTNTSIDSAIDEVLMRLDSQRGGLLASSYEYPGRYKRWAIGFVNPPLEISTRDRTFTITAHNERGLVLLGYLEELFLDKPYIEEINREDNSISGSIKPSNRLFSEEERSRQPSVFSVIREIISAFFSPLDENLGLYGALGYDLVFQFEQMPKLLEREDDQRDLVLYLPDELFVVDYHLQQAFRMQYDFVTKNGSTRDLPRKGEKIDFRGKRLNVTQGSDHAPGEYQQQVIKALDYFRRGDLFEVVPSQCFSETCEKSPTELFRTLMKINPSPYGFIFNMGGEYL
ncbi:MAG: chorismate-binding protein, partial [Rivularia sp. (in: cyanobacteria)]